MPYTEDERRAVAVEMYGDSHWAEEAQRLVASMGSARMAALKHYIEHDPDQITEEGKERRLELAWLLDPRR